MAVSFYRVSVPVFIKHLKGLASCLKKTQALYSEKKYDEATLLNYRLYPDMFNFIKQIQNATSHAVGSTAMLAGIEAPKTEDKEKSLAELIARVEAALAFLEGIKPQQVDGAEDKDITIKRADGDQVHKGIEWLLNNKMPNFYFHTTTAYDIMRHNGVEIGKGHFMGTR